MELLYAHEHVTCFNYEKGDRPTIEKIKLAKDQKWEMTLVDNKIIFMMDGSMRFSYGKYTDRIFPKGKMMILTSGSRITGIAEEECYMIIIRLHNTKQLCDCFDLNLLLREKDKDFVSDLYFLDINERVETYLDFLNTCVNDGLKCTFYFELKSKELHFLLRAYYSKKDLLYFFYPLLSHDITFSDFVIKNHFKTKTVQELADLSNYSLSGFQKRFKKVFGISAYHWMKDERSKTIYHEINSTEKSFKEISDEFGFSSPSHFNDFCKSQFGATPGKIRNKKSSLYTNA